MLACNSIGPGIVLIIVGVLFSPLLLASLITLVWAGARQLIPAAERGAWGSPLACLWSFSGLSQVAVLIWIWAR